MLKTVIRNPVDSSLKQKTTANGFPSRSVPSILYFQSPERISGSGSWKIFPVLSTLCASRMSRPSFASSSLKCLPGITLPADRQCRTRSAASVRDKRPTCIVVFYTIVVFLSIEDGRAPDSGRRRPQERILNPHPLHHLAVLQILGQQRRALGFNSRGHNQPIPNRKPKPLT